MVLPESTSSSGIAVILLQKKSQPREIWGLNLAILSSSTVVPDEQLKSGLEVER